MRPTDKHVNAFMKKAMGLPLERDRKRAAKLVKEMSNLYVWIEKKGDDGVKGFLGQFMSMPFSNLLIEVRELGVAGRVPHALLVSFLELTHTRGTFRNIEWLYEREIPSQAPSSQNIGKTKSSKYAL